MKPTERRPHKPLPMRHLLLTRALYFCCFIQKKTKKAGNLICLSNWYDSQREKSSQELVSSMWFSAFNTLLIIKHAPGFIFFCLAVEQQHLAMQTLNFMCEFSTVILCVHFFFLKLNSIIFYVDICCWFGLVWFFNLFPTIWVCEPSLLTGSWLETC